MRCTAKTRYVSCSLHSPIHSGSCVNSPLQGSNMRPPSLLERSSLRNLTIVFCVHITTLGSGVSVTHNRKQLFSISSAFHIQPDHMTNHRIVISCSNLLEGYRLLVLLTLLLQIPVSSAVPLSHTAFRNISLPGSLQDDSRLLCSSWYGYVSSCGL